MTEVEVTACQFCGSDKRYITEYWFIGEKPAFFSAECEACGGKWYETWIKGVHTTHLEKDWRWRRD